MRLIDADKLVKTFCSHCVDHDECKSECMDLKIIKSMKTVEAEPIRHGYWIPINPDVYGADLFSCSVCGIYSGDGHCRKEFDYEYCPWCGAKMDEKETNQAE